MKVDPYANEPTVELDPALFRAYIEAAQNADAWKKEADRLKREMIEILGDAVAGLVDGRKLVTYREQERFAEAALIKDNPDLAQHFIVAKYQDVFDMDKFRAHHPEIADKYRVRSFRSIGEI